MSLVDREPAQRIVELLLTHAAEAAHRRAWEEAAVLAEDALSIQRDNREADALARLARLRLGPQTPTHGVDGSGDSNAGQPAPPIRGADRTVPLTLGNRLRISREAQGLTQAAVAEAVGMTQAALSNYERGTRELSLSTLLKLASVLNLDIAQILQLPDVERAVQQELASFGESRVDLRTGVHVWSDAMYRILGIPTGSVEPSAREFLRFVHPDDAQRALRWNRELRAGKVEGPITFRIVRGDDQSERYVEILSRIEFDGNGDPIAQSSITQDVTERIEAGNVLRESQTHLALATKVAKLVSWELDLRTGRLRGSGRMPTGEESDGESPREIEWEWYAQNVHPEDRERFIESQRHMREQGIPLNHQYRLIDHAGNVHVIATRSQVIHNEAGQPARIIGTTQDITDLAEATNKLRAQEQRYAELYEGAPCAFVTIDDCGVVVQTNRSMYELTGHTPARLLDASMQDLVHPDDAAIFKDHERLRAAQRQLIRLVRADDSYVQVEASAQPLHRADGSIQHWVCSFVKERWRPESAGKAAT